MRVRAIDVHAVRIEGVPLALRACTLAVRTGRGGHRAWDASCWTAGAAPGIASGDGPGGPFAVWLVVDGGTLRGEAFVSAGRPDAPASDGVPLFLVGVGNLVPWPG